MTETQNNHDSMEILTQAARKASLQLPALSTAQKNAVLLACAQTLRQQANRVLEANEADQLVAKAMLDQGKITQSTFKRLVITPEKLEQMAVNLESVAALEDPVGQIQLARRLDEGLDLYRISTPIGVLLIIFESRPEVVVQISALAIKSGNAVILKGGSEVAQSNRVLAELIRQTVAGFDYMPQECVQLVQSREEVSAIIKMREDIDLIIPRGGAGLIRSILENTQIPVLAHADGVCHVYLDEAAEPDMARRVTIDSKTQYAAVCNAMETLLVHEKFPLDALLQILSELQQADVELRVCERTRKRLGTEHSLSLKDATAQDWSTEYTDLILSIKTVTNLQQAMEHINRHGSKHTDSIVTSNPQAAEIFLNGVDAANVFWNASTRFSDGFRYGFGAEVGISTTKTHARGPVGLEGLTIYKYKLIGKGQIVGDYGPKGRSFLHQPIPAEEQKPL